MAEQMGWAVRGTINTTPVEFVSTNIKETVEIVQDDGLRGVRSRALERTAQGVKKVAGTLVMEPTPAELALILPLVCQSSTGTTLTDAMQDLTLVIDLRTKLNTFVGRFTKMNLTGESGGKKLRVTLQFVGKTLVVASGGSLSGTPDITVRPYMFYDSTSGITIGGTAYSIDKFDLGIDNKIVPTYMQGQTATDLEPTDRVVTLGVQTRYNAAEDALLVLAMAGPVIASPLTASIAFTNGSNSATFTFGALVAQSESVVVPGRNALRLPLNYQCYKVGTTLETVPVLV